MNIRHLWKKLFFSIALVSSAAVNAATIQNELVLQAGDGYALKEIVYVDDNGISRSVELFYIHNVEGAVNAFIEAGLPLEELEEIQNEADPWGGAWGRSASAVTRSTTTVQPEQWLWVINKNASLLNDVQNADQYILDMGLEDVVAAELLVPEGDIPDATTLNSRLFGRKLFNNCSGWRQGSKSVQKNVDKSFSKSESFGDGAAVATIKADIDVNADINFSLGYEYKRRFCIPYKFRYKTLDTSVSYDTSGSLEINGSLQKTITNKSWQIAEPKVLDSVFLVGPVPVRIAVKVPIEVGTGDITVQASGKIAAEKALRYTGNFSFHCDRSTCERVSSSHQNYNKDFINRIGAAASAKATMKPYLNVAAKPILYAEAVLYVKVGAQPSFPLEVFGYYGNLCGDGDNNGHNETVAAALGTLAFEAGVTAEAKLFGQSLLKPKYWKLWHKDLLMVDFISAGSSAFSPLLRPTTEDTSLIVQLPVSIRQCVASYAQRFPVDFHIDWGDGLQSNINDVATSKSLNHTYSQSGTYPISVTYKNQPTTVVNVTVDDSWGGAW